MWKIEQLERVHEFVRLGYSIRRTCEIVFDGPAPPLFEAMVAGLKR